MAKIKAKKRPNVKRTITVRADQDDWLEANSINPSRLVQKCIDHIMNPKSNGRCWGKKK